MKKTKKIDIADFLRNNMAWVLLIVCSAIFAVISPNFFSVVNIINILNQNAYIIITALGISFIMMAGEVDISVGYAISLNGVAVALLMTKVGLPSALCVIISIVLGIVICLVNMLIAYKLNLQLFIASIAGFMTGIGAVILSARLGSVTANMGTGLEFTIITAVLLGGVSVRGGEGKISGVVAGVLILAILSNGMQLARLDVYYQFVAKGIIMLAAIGFDVYQLSRRKKATLKVQENKKE